ncbi:MAG: hypothetical protein ACR2HJ_03715 [Fimbriimonadales bacterium]
MFLPLMGLVLCQTGDATALDQLLVLERLQPLSLSKPQCRDFLGLAVLIGQAHAEASQKLAKLADQERLLGEITDDLVAGKTLSLEALKALADRDRV